MRNGMANLVQRLRQMTEAGISDYTLGDETYWSDNHLQATLDEFRTRKIDLALRVEPDYVNAEYIYQRYVIPYNAGNAVEGTAGGTDVFRVYDSTGANIAGSVFAFNERDLSITFNNDTEGSARYWSGYSYDLIGAARQTWLMKASHVWNAVNFSVDWQRFDREALYRHCVEMAANFGANLAGGRLGSQGSMKSTKMQRTDLAGSEKDRF